MLRTHRSLEGLLCNLMMKMMRFFLLFHFNGAPVEWNWQGKTEVLGEKPVPVPLCPPQIPHGLTRYRTRASALRGRRLTAWRPIFIRYLGLSSLIRWTGNIALSTYTCLSGCKLHLHQRIPNIKQSRCVLSYSFKRGYYFMLIPHRLKKKSVSSEENSQSEKSF
jgi:hypothetical protein